MQFGNCVSIKKASAQRTFKYSLHLLLIFAKS